MQTDPSIWERIAEKLGVPTAILAVFIAGIVWVIKRAVPWIIGRIEKRDAEEARREADREAIRAASFTLLKETAIDGQERLSRQTAALAASLQEMDKRAEKRERVTVRAIEESTKTLEELIKRIEKNGK